MKKTFFQSKLSALYSIVLLVVAGFIISGGTAIAQHEHNMMEHSKHAGHKMENMNSDDKTTNDSSIIRKGTIDLKTIDKNNDGFVYQDMMDWNVISDAPGKCPLCKMDLVKVSLADAYKNLKNNKFDVKKLK